MENFKMVAKTFFGFEEVLEQELLQLGAQKIEKHTRMVSFFGDKGFLYKSNLCLRTALKILKPIATFKVYDEQSLYDEVKKIAWDTIFNVDDTFVIDTTIYSEAFNNSLFVSLKSKDAIVDFFREKHGKRPSIDKDFPVVRIHVHLDRNLCTVSLDASGGSLHLRGYRTATNIAPINEVLAAGLVLMSGWNGQGNFLDPMCGSGTLLIEAAMIACNIPANINRKEFGFEKWNDWDPDLFDTILASQLKKTKEFHYKIIGFDKAPSAVRKAKDNIDNANLDDYIEVFQNDFFESKKELEGPLTMVFNPPYNERLNIEVERFYREIGDTLKQNYHNTSAWFITGNLEALKYIGLRPSRKIKLFNGKLETRFVNLQIYEGSKKAKFQQ